MIKKIGAAAAALVLVPLVAADMRRVGGPEHLRAQQDTALPGVPVRSTRAPEETTGRPYTATSPVWPAGSATVPLRNDARQAGSLPVFVRAAAATSTTSATAVKVDVPGRATTAAAKVP